VTLERVYGGLGGAIKPKRVATTLDVAEHFLLLAVFTLEPNT